jgi:signal transduction histidine kinase/ActR/RegA family two-component response regulator
MKTSIRIAVIDDDRDLASNIQDILELEGYHVRVVNSSRDAIALFEENAFDLAIVDIKLPDMHGPELVQVLKEVNPETEYIMVTGHATLETAVDSVQEPKVIGYETKPLDMDHFLSLLRQATRRQQAEREAAKRMNSMRQAEDIAQLGYFERNWQTGDGHWSDGFRKLLNVAPEMDCTHEEFLHYVHPDDRERVSGHIKSTLMEKKSMDVEFRIVQNGGNIINIHGTARNTYDKKGNPLSTSGVFQNITKRKRLERQLREARKMESLGVLTGGIAHEFNNILSIIIGNTELAQDDVPDWNPARSNLDEIKNASLRARDVVKQLLDFTRKSAQQLQPLNIVTAIQESIKLLQASTPSDIEIQHMLPFECGTIQGDPAQIKVLTINLCTNAVQAMVNTGGILEIGVRDIMLSNEDALSYPQATSGPYVQLTIRDTGHGIASEIQDRIFDPYFTTREVGEGSGMGLAVVYGIVKNHGGAISVSSKPQEGTTVKVLFPIIDHD